MAPKKRKLSDESEEREAEDVDLGLKKRKRTDIDYAELIQELFETIRNHKTEDGRLLCEEFIRAPKRRTDPDYYNVIDSPIDLQKIHNNLKSDVYKNLDEFTSDIQLLVENTKAYYKDDSQEYQDIGELWELFSESKTVLLGEEMAAFQVDDDADEEEEEEEEEEDEEEDAFEEAKEEKMETQPPREEVKVLYPDSSSIVIPGTGGNPTIKLKMPTSPMPSPVVEEVKASSVDQAQDVEDSEEVEDAGNSEDLSPVAKDDENVAKTSESGRSLRERRYTYRDFLFPKVTISEKQEENSKEKEAEREDTEDRGSVGGDEDDSCYENLFAAVVMAKDGERCISEMFKILPSRKKYPDYYEVIKEPMDLKTIAQRIQSSDYKHIDDMIKDLHMMVHNARTFNEPGSQIYRDAVTLKKLVLNQKHEIDLQANMQRPVRSQRIRSRKVTAGQRLSQVIAGLESDSDKEEPVVVAPPVVNNVEDDSGEDDGVNDTDDDPMWVLFRAVKAHKNSLGQRLSEPFLRMPSKRIYPDYYNEIKKPMSLLKIQKKLKNGQYHDFEQMLGELDLVFENAKQYNMDESKLYKDAVKLHSVMKAKAKEIKEEMGDYEICVKKGRRSYDACSTTSGTSEEGGKKKLGRKSLSPEEQLKRRLWLIYKTVYDYAFDGRPLISIFITLPSKKDYPDYYQVISEPIDMTMIENKIKLDKYCNEHALVADLELMFNNARHYNEENSQVYKDAEKLERILTSKVCSMPAIDGTGIIKTPGRNKPKTKSSSTLTAKLQDLYNTIRDYSDSRKRVLSTPFMKLPLKSEYPDYYEVIKRPMDMQKIFQRMISNQYPTLEEMVSDIVLMFDNACKYNEPDSLIYKDALTLQRICLEKKTELSVDDYTNDVPDVRAQITELMTNLFISTFNHMDEEGRCYSDSFMELPSKIPVEDPENGEDREKLAPTFERVKRNLDRGRYRRMDRFQEDMFEVFEFARSVSRTDSQVYEDSIELQMFFIRIRDELCKNGDHLLTPALSYRETHFHKDLERERQAKSPLEQRADEEKKKQPDGSNNYNDDSREEQAGQVETVDFKDQTFASGDFIYIEPRDKGMVEPHIVCIERMWKEDNGELWLYGCWFLRPNETFHLATRKFLEKEVFKSDFYDSVPFSKVMSKCHVMSVRDYFKMKPEGYADKDVYVCESRYSGRTKTFKKIKVTSNWQLPKSDFLKLVPRDQPFSQIRVASVFAEKAQSEDSKMDDGLTDILDKGKELVILESPQSSEEGYTTYEQYQTSIIWIKLGDHVYVQQSENQEKPTIMGIDKIWTDQSGETFIHGPVFLHPADVDHAPTRLFYKREVFRSSTEQTCHVSAVTSRCMVLTYKEYITSRPTEIAENDIYICEAKYTESEKAIKKFNKPIKKPSLSIKVCDDEILFFRKPIVPHKEPSPLLLKVPEEPLADLDSTTTMDSSFSENYSAQGESSTQEAPTPEPSEKKKKQKIKGRNMTGYIMFAAEYRKEIAEANPEMSFGEISKIVGAKWKGLEREVKEKYEERAKATVAESVAKQAEADRAFNESLNMYPPSQSPAGEHSMSPGPSGQGSGQGQSMPPPPPPKPPEPMFVSVPPKTQRLVHSEAYLRYIENLNPESRTVGNWDRTLSATPENTPLPSNNKLPIQWLANGVGHHENATNALWALRDLMMKDAMTISRTLEFSQL